MQLMLNTNLDLSKHHPELQVTRCMSIKYKNEDFPRCVSCIRRWAGDTCRFQGIRILVKDAAEETVGVGFLENPRSDQATKVFPNKWNVELTAGHIRILQVG